MKTKKKITFDQLSQAVHQLPDVDKDALIVDLLHLAFLEYDIDIENACEHQGDDSIAYINIDKECDSGFIGNVTEVLWHHAGKRILGDN